MSEKNKKYQKERRRKLKEAGLCICCGKRPPITTDKCQECREKHLNSVRKCHKKTSAENRNKGLCCCGRPPKPGGKICEICAERGLRNYYKDKAKGICAYCSKLVIPGKTRCFECSEKHKAEGRQIKLEVFKAYGGSKCNCCGETIDKFLTLDHVNNDGNKHRKQVGRTSVYRWLKYNNFPSGFQVLCWNCNMGRQHNCGICPHKQKEL